MCDIYYAKCKRCPREFDMHIGDFCVPRSSVDVFCEDHLPNANYNLFTVLGGEDYDLKNGEKVGVRVRDKEHKRNDDICPNAMSELKMVEK